MIDLLLDRVDSPVGELLVVSDGNALLALDYAGYEPRMEALLRRRFGEIGLRPARDPCAINSRLNAYFEGDLSAIEPIPVGTGGTSFQHEVWSELRRIAPGSSITYGELAARLGRSPTASRADGLANSLNPIAIVIPCHRVIGANAQLTGYAGGLERKDWLLHHEGAQLPLLQR